jgi:hypothetical protein
VKLLLTASLYFLAVFAVGFIIGPIRVLLLEPRLGPVAGVLCEAPFLFAAFIGAAHWSLRATRIALDARSLLLVGIIALVMQQLADFAGGAVLRGWTVSEQLTQLSTPQGAIYVLLLIIFVVMPLVVSRFHKS